MDWIAEDSSFISRTGAQRSARSTRYCGEWVIESRPVELRLNLAGECDRGLLGGRVTGVTCLMFMSGYIYKVIYFLIIIKYEQSIFMA